MAEVFVAVAQGGGGFEKPVVIKRLLPQLAAIPRFRQMFLDEARITANLQHGNIVQVLDMGSMDGRPFLTLEYVHGRDLRTVYYRAKDNGQPLPPGLVAYIAAEACRALDYAHRKQDDEGQPLKIVHRDINPANIFLSNEGGVKVGDFGLAKARDNLEQSEAGLVKGKFSYMSPEQARGEEVDHRSDLFSLGITLYEITCGRLPFAAPTDLGVLQRVREASFDPPSKVIPGFHARLETTILRAMKPDRDDRFPTADAMRRELDRYAQGLTAPTGDRELDRFLQDLFPENSRRSQSHLIRLPQTSTLPPPMTSISRADGFSEYQQAAQKGGSHVVQTQFGRARAPMPSNEVPTAASAATGGLPTTGPLPRIADSVVTGPHPELRHGDLPLGDLPLGDLPLGDLPRGDLPQGGLPDAGTALPPQPKQRRGVVIGVLIGALLAGAGFGAWIYGGAGQQTAALRLSSTPTGAQILLGGKLTGLRTPAELRLPVGQDVRVALRHPAAGPVERRFQFQREGRYAHAFELPALEQALTLESVPAAVDVLVDGELRGQTPLTVHIGRGKHRVELRRRGYEPKTLQHSADRAKATLKIALERQAGDGSKASHSSEAGHSKTPAKAKAARRSPFAVQGSIWGTLQIDTAQRARVYLNGRYAGRTPGFDLRLPVGSYNIRVKSLDSKAEHRARIVIKNRRTHRLRLTPPTP